MDIITSIKELDTAIFLFCNGKHNAFFDVVMGLASDKLIWIPLYAFFLYLVFKFTGKRIWLLLAMFLSLFFKNRIRYFFIFIFLWALFVSYSRVYNGVHYPADVTVGAIVGMLIGGCIYSLYRLANSRFSASKSSIG